MFVLDSKPNKAVWQGIVVMIALQGLSLGLGLFARHLGFRTRGTDVPNLATASVPELFVFVSLTLVAPFWEEIMMRGFLYRAFRSSYSKTASSVLIVSLTAITHGPRFIGSIIAAIVLIAFALVLCWLMERTGKIWNCILAHLVFNSIFVLFYFAHR